jgi:hypothetical protein
LEFDRVINFLDKNGDIRVHTMNSGQNSEADVDYDAGLNVVIGGNSLGRGVTFRGLQTVYYCRSSKTPQADTAWQHSRMFGYDREPSLMRVFMPRALFSLFSELNNSNEVLYTQIENGNFKNLQLMFPPGIKPTRRNVIDRDKFAWIIGGVDYFPPEPDQNNVSSIDKILSKYPATAMTDISLDELQKIIKSVMTDEENKWLVDSILSAIESIRAQKDSLDLAKLIIRVDRNVSKGKGTLLSPDDRALGGKIKDVPTLTMYRLNGRPENGWEGKPFWVPNIKLPSEKVFYRVES